MRLQSGRQLGVIWISAVLVFLLSAWAATALLPTMLVTRPTSSYWLGLVGLLAIGLALALTWDWVARAGPVSSAARVSIRLALTLLSILWVLAMIFPFL